MALEDAQRELILHHANRLLQSRQHPKTICPSEIARALSREELNILEATDWRHAMDNIRQVVWEKREAGEVEIMQKGQAVEATSLEEIRGPIRIRLLRK